MVSGCFDLLHSGHVAFLQEASQLGNLYVCIGSDDTVSGLKGRRPSGGMVGGGVDAENQIAGADSVAHGLHPLARGQIKPSAERGKGA